MPPFPNAYWSPAYLTPQRFSSIGYQWRVAMQQGGESFIEIGVGSGLLSLLLRESGCVVHSLDVRRVVRPSVIGDARRLPFADAAADTILCFQVLEHLPFADFTPALIEFRRIARRSVILSVPDRSPYRTANPLIDAARFVIYHARLRSGRLRRHVNHRWELGDGTVSAPMLREAARMAGFTQIDTFRNPDYAYHHFFVMR